MTMSSSSGAWPMPQSPGTALGAARRAGQCPRVGAAPPCAGARATCPRPRPGWGHHRRSLRDPPAEFPSQPWGASRGVLPRRPPYSRWPTVGPREGCGARALRAGTEVAARVARWGRVFRPHRATPARGRTSRPGWRGQGVERWVPWPMDWGCSPERVLCVMVCVIVFVCGMVCDSDSVCGMVCVEWRVCGGV